MGFFSSSESKSSSSSSAAETGQQVQDSGSATALSNIKAGKYGKININVDSVDHGAVEGALVLAGGTVGEAFDYAKDQNAGVLAYAAGATKLNSDLASGVMVAGAGLADQAFEFAGDALEWVEREQKNSFSELKGISSKAMDDVKALASQQATNNDERIQQLAGWAMLAVVVVVVAMFWRQG